MNNPDFILIGESKCGTTSIFNYLIEHPDILDTYGNGESYDSEYATKEIRFFDRFYSKGIEWYRSCFPETGPGQITGEATPMYMYRTGSALRIREHFPDIKLIVALRNPTDRMISNYQHNYKWVPGWREKYPDLRTYLNSSEDRDYYLIEKGLYLYSLKKWMRFFPGDQFHIIISEKMFASPSLEYGRLLEFLEVPPFELKSFKIYRENKYDDVGGEVRNEIERIYKPFNDDLQEFLKMDLPW